MIEFTCRRCAGRRTIADDNGKPCFVCLGKGKIKIEPQKIRETYHKK